jgi:redox-sensitive bicupin YhaK (pirin superfamily)
MLKKFSVARLAREAGGEHVLGVKELHTHACYLIYGELAPGEQGRPVKPGSGHEEILVAVSGDLELNGAAISGTLPQGEAVHLREEESCTLSNPGSSPAIYILAGGHSGKPH